MAGNLNFLDLPDAALWHLVQLPGAGERLLGVCRRLRALCHASATSVKLLRSYEAGVDDPQVAILARCPRLRRVDASALYDVDAHTPWPLAAASQLTSLTAHWFWGDGNLPLALEELHICRPRSGSEDTYSPRVLSLVRSVRDMPCTVTITVLHCDDSDGRALSALAMHGRVFVMENYNCTSTGWDMPAAALFAPGAPLSRMRSLALIVNSRDLTPCSACWVPSLTGLIVLGRRLTSLQGLEPDRLGGLTSLTLAGCTSLTTLRHLAGLEGLRDLDLRECSDLVRAEVAQLRLPHLE